MWEGFSIGLSHVSVKNHKHKCDFIFPNEINSPAQSSNSNAGVDMASAFNC